jgi:hypothetical protein
MLRSVFINLSWLLSLFKGNYLLLIISLLVYSFPLSLSSLFDSLYDGIFMRLLVEACTFINIEVWRDRLDPRKNSCYLISFRLGRLCGYFCNIAETRPFREADTDVLSGKVYDTDLIFLYVSLTSFDSKGGRPNASVYMIMPKLHVSTS